MVSGLEQSIDIAHGHTSLGSFAIACALKAQLLYSQCFVTKASNFKHTNNSKPKRQADLRLGGHLALVSTGVPRLGGRHPQRPLVGAIRVESREPSVTAICVHAHCQDVKVTLADPGYLKTVET